MSEDLEQRVAELEEVVAVLSDDLEDERDRREALEEELAEKDERISELEQREETVEVREPEDEDRRQDLRDVWVAGRPLGRLLRTTREDVLALEERLEDEQPEPADDLEETAPPIYDLLRTPPDRLKPTERRTRFLWSDLNDYAERAPKGYVVHASDARRVLEAAEPEDSDCSRLTANHVGRVFDLSVELTRESAYVRSEGGERQLVIPTDWETEAREAALTPS